MNRYFKTGYFFFFLILSVVLLLKCVSNMAGGETLNEKRRTVYLSDGTTPASMAKVVIAYDSNVVWTDHTDKKGNFTVPALESGNYNLYIWKKADGELLSASQNSIYISSDSNNVQDDTLYKSGVITGFVKLQQRHIYKLREVRIQILGELFETYADSNGRFELDSIPRSESYIIKINPPAGLEYAPKVLQNVYYPDDKDTLILDTVSLEYTGIPIVDDLTFHYDSLNGIVNLNWTKPPFNTSFDYVVYRKLMGKAVSSIDSLEAGDTPFLSDTIYSDSPQAWQHNLSDSMSYKYKYWVVTRDQSNKLSESNIDPEDTVTVRSPIEFRAKFNFKLVDSLTKKVITQAFENRTVALIYNISSSRVPFSIIDVKDESGMHIVDTLPAKASLISDTLFWKDTAAGVKHYHFRVGSNSGFRTFDTASIDVKVKDANLYLEKLSPTSEPVKTDGPFSLKAVVKNSGVSDFAPDSIVDLSVYYDDTAKITVSKSIRSFKPNDSLVFVIDSGEISKAKWSITPGLHAIKAVVNESGAVSEANYNDNRGEKEIFVRDVNLKLANTFFYPSNPKPGDLVGFYCWIGNLGSTASDSTVPIRINFMVDGSLINQTIIQQPIPEQSAIIKTSLGIWEAVTGTHIMSVSIDTQLCNYETDNSDNAFIKTITVNNIDLRVESFVTKDPSRENGVTFEAVVKNTGTTPVVDSTIRLKFTIDENVSTTADTLLSSLSPGDSIKVSVKCDSASAEYIKNSSSTLFNVTATVDPDNTIGESNEDNNSFFTNFTIQ